MKKTIVTLSFVFTFIVYGLYRYLGVSQTSTYVATDTPGSKITLSTPPIAQKNIYTDGTYIGSVADAYYGNIQVQATIQNGKVADVSFLQYPNDRNTSRQINGQAMPILKSEAISSQNANVDIVSGATDSSQAFMQSLDSALAQALNS